MNSLSPLEAVAQDYAGELSLVHSLLEQASCDAIDLYDAWHRLPGGTAFSAMARDRFHELVMNSKELASASDKIRVEDYGDNWVRIYFPALGIRLPLRSRPRAARLLEPGLFTDVTEPDDGQDPIFGLPEAPQGHTVMFWRFNLPGRAMARWSIARVQTMDEWIMDCPMYEEVDLPTDVPLSVPTRVPVEATNEHDDLSDIVGAHESPQPLTEEQTTDRREEGTRNDSADPASGDSI